MSCGGREGRSRRAWTATQPAVSKELGPEKDTAENCLERAIGGARNAHLEGRLRAEEGPRLAIWRAVDNQRAMEALELGLEALKIAISEVLREIRARICR